MANAIAWIMANKVMLSGFVLWAFSEAIALSPGLESNSLFNLIYNLIKSLLTPKPAAK